MTLAEIVKAVRDRFEEQVARRVTGLQVVYDNGPEPVATVPLWCRLSTETDRWEEVSTMPTRERLRGRAIADLNVPIAKGDKAILDVITIAEEAFDRVRLASPMLRFYRPSAVGVPAEFGPWFRRRVVIEFYADEIRTGS